MKTLEETLWEKKVFCNSLYNSIFELQTTLATHYIYMPWILMDKLHELQSCNSPYIQCNSHYYKSGVQFTSLNHYGTLKMK